MSSMQVIYFSTITSIYLVIFVSSKTFVQTINLQKHLKVHKYKRLFNDNNVHIEDENEVHECEFCSKTYLLHILFH